MSVQGYPLGIWDRDTVFAFLARPHILKKKRKSSLLLLSILQKYTFYRWRNLNEETLSKFSMVTEPVNSRVVIQTQMCQMSKFIFPLLDHLVFMESHHISLLLIPTLQILPSATEILHSLWALLWLNHEGLGFFSWRPIAFPNCSTWVSTTFYSILLKDTPRNLCGLPQSPQGWGLDILLRSLVLSTMLSVIIYLQLN